LYWSSSGSRLLASLFTSELGLADLADILKFHFVAQLLFDSNCLLLVLKMFGLSDVAMSVTAKNELEDEK
jgi:hypothetical protein